MQKRIIMSVIVIVVLFSVAMPLLTVTTTANAETLYNHTISGIVGHNLNGSFTITGYFIINIADYYGTPYSVLEFTKMLYNTNHRTASTALRFDYANTSDYGNLSGQGGFYATYVSDYRLSLLYSTGTAQANVIDNAIFTDAFHDELASDAYQDGYNTGYSAGQTAGYNAGYSAGQTAGYNTGYSAGQTAGYNSGVAYADGRVNTDSASYSTGYNTGYSAGQTAGYNSGVAYADGRVNTDSASYTAGYNSGVAYADGRVNTDSASYTAGYNTGYDAGEQTQDAYQDGYNSGVAYADGRVNTDSASYTAGYNTGYDAGENGASYGVFKDCIIDGTLYFEDGDDIVLQAGEYTPSLFYNGITFNNLLTQYPNDGNIDHPLRGADLTIHFDTPFGANVVPFFWNGDSDVLDFVFTGTNNKKYFATWEYSAEKGAYGWQIRYKNGNSLYSGIPTDDVLITALDVSFGRQDQLSGLLYAPSSVYGEGYTDGYNAGYEVGDDDGYIRGTSYGITLADQRVNTNSASYQAGTTAGISDASPVQGAKAVFQIVVDILNIPLFAEWFTIGTILIIVVVLGLTMFVIKLGRGR